MRFSRGELSQPCARGSFWTRRPPVVGIARRDEGLAPTLVPGPTKDLNYGLSGLLPPRHASPGLKTCGSRPSLTSCPKDCEMPPGPFGAMLISRLRGAPGSSFLPENTQIEFACVGPAVAFPLPVTSPAKAALALAPATTTAHTAAASIDFFRSMILSPFEVSPSFATLLRWRHRRQPSLAGDSGKDREEISYAWRKQATALPASPILGPDRAVPIVRAADCACRDCGAAALVPDHASRAGKAAGSLSTCSSTRSALLAEPLALFTVRNKSWVTRKVATQVWQGVSSAFSVPTWTRRRTGMGAGRFCDR